MEGSLCLTPSVLCMCRRSLQCQRLVSVFRPEIRTGVYWCPHGVDKGKRRNKSLAAFRFHVSGTTGYNPPNPGFFGLSGVESFDLVHVHVVESMMQVETNFFLPFLIYYPKIFSPN